jgi:hypothetical protein
MASTYTPLGVELQATGENAGTWGTKTNTNLQIFEQIVGGFTAQSIAGGAQNTDLSVSDGSTGATLSHRMIEFTGSITGNQVVRIPIDVQTFYYLRNSTTNGSGTPTVQFKYITGSGDSFTFAGTNKGDAVVFATGNDGTNPDIYTLPAGDVTLTGTQTLTNKTLTAPKIGTSILDTNGAELLLLTATSSAVNEITLANAATGNGPILSATGETNVDINLNPKGTGVLKSGAAAVNIAGKETMWVPASAMYGATTNPAAAEQVETTATRPDMKVLDFDASTDEFAQFSVAFPKSWNEGTVTYQVYWTPASTNTGDCIFGLQGVSCGDSDTIDVVYGTAINITDAGIGTVEDQQVSAESSAVTIAGSPAVDQLTYFQLFRDANAGGDTFSADARVLGIKLFFTTDAANDA